MLKCLLYAWQVYEAYFIAALIVVGAYVVFKMIQAKQHNPFPDEDEWGP
jgi:hypothetical protein